MAAELRDTLTTGVWMEFRNAAGHSLGQAVFADWRGKPLPAVGDQVVHALAGAPTGRPLQGTVIRRTFDVQQDADGQTEVWAFLVIETEPLLRPRVPGLPACLRN